MSSFVTQAQRARDLLAQASIVAEGPAMRWQAPTSHGKPGDAAPQGGGHSIHDQIAQRLRGAQDEADLERAIGWGEQKLREIKSRPRELTVHQRKYWTVIASQGRDYRDVAEAEGLSDTQVWKMRRDAGYEPRKGYSKAA